MYNLELRLKDVYMTFSQQTKNFIDLHYSEDMDCPISSITYDIAYIWFDGGFQNYKHDELKRIFDEINKYTFVYKEEL